MARAHNKFVSSHVIEVSHVPKDITGAAQNGDWFSLKEAEGVVFVIVQGAWAGGTPAVTLEQATAVAGTGGKALGMAEYWDKTGMSTTTFFARHDITSDTFNLGTTANKVTVIEVSANDLDKNNGFDCVRLVVGTPGTNADLLAVVAIFYGLRNQGDPATILYDPKID